MPHQMAIHDTYLWRSPYSLGWRARPFKDNTISERGSMLTALGFVWCETRSLAHRTRLTPGIRQQNGLSHNRGCAKSLQGSLCPYDWKLIRRPKKYNLCLLYTSDA